MLDRIIDEKWLRADGVLGLFPANSVGDDIEVYTDETRELGGRRRCTRCASRGSTARACPTGRCPTSSPLRRPGCADHVGAFAVTAGLGVQEKVAEFKAAIDDYNAILLEALADRLAEAFAERLHERVRRDLWGYAPDEHLPTTTSSPRSTSASGRRPGYPACPDHTEKETALGAARRGAQRGIRLTESMAMWPGAAVSGLVLLAPAVPVLRRRAARAGPGRGLRGAQGLDPRRGRALAGPEPGLPARGLTPTSGVRAHLAPVAARDTHDCGPGASGRAPARRRESTGELARRLPKAGGRRPPGHRARLHRAVGHTFYSPWHEHRRPDRAAAPTRAAAAAHGRPVAEPRGGLQAVPAALPVPRRSTSCPARRARRPPAAPWCTPCWSACSTCRADDRTPEARRRRCSRPQWERARRGGARARRR